MIDPRKTALAKLASYFPLGASLDRSKMYLENRELARVVTVDLVEAVERLCARRSEKGFPALGVLLAACREACSDRLAAERAGGDPDEQRNGRPPTSDELDQCEKIRDLARVGIFWCETCGDFKQARSGTKPSGWHPCHYHADRRLWESGRQSTMTRELIHAAWEKLQPEKRKLAPRPQYRRVIEHELPPKPEEEIPF
jgi:hypothetical protein